MVSTSSSLIGWQLINATEAATLTRAADLSLQTQQRAAEPGQYLLDWVNDDGHRCAPDSDVVACMLATRP
jgi:hypothetical protein